jgi:hypothetical protein
MKDSMKLFLLVEENLAARVPPPDEAFLEQLEIGRFEAVEQRDLVS